MSTDQNGQPWTYARIRRRLNTLVEIMPMAVGDERMRRNIIENLVTIRACLDDWNREGIFQHERK